MSECDIVVDIRHGKHSTRPPKGMDDLIAGFLKDFVPTGDYVVHLGKNIWGSKHTQGEVKAVRTEGNKITLVSQPGDNGTRFESHVVLGGLDTQDIFNRMKKGLEIKADVPKTEEPEIMIDSAELEKLVQSIETMEVIEMKKEEVAQPTKLSIRSLLANNETLHLMLILLSEYQEKVGYIDTPVCSSLLVENGLVKAGHPSRATGRIFPELAKMGYLEPLEKRKRYKLSLKAMELLHPIQTPVTVSVAVPTNDVSIDKPSVGQGSNEIEANLRSRIDLLKVLSEAEKELKAAAASAQETAHLLATLVGIERQAKEKVAAIKDKLIDDLNK